MTETSSLREMAPHRRLTARDWGVMSALMAGIMLSPFSVTFTSVALPTMRRYFQVDVEQATWIATAYFIPAVALMPLQTQIGARWGQRRIYVLGLFVVAVGSFLTAMAPGFRWLLAGRIMQGVGWSALYPIALLLIRREFPAGRQGEMMGLWESSVGFTTIISPVLGGALVEFVGWQSLYALTGVVAGLGVLLSLRFIPREDVVARESFNALDLVALTLALVLTLLSISRRQAPVLLAAGLAWLFWLVLRRQAATNYVPAGIFRNRRFVTASLAAHVRMLVALAAVTALPLFFEDVQGLRPSHVGSLLLIYSVFLFLGAWPGGRWSDRAGAAVPGFAGYVAMFVGVGLLLFMKEQLAIWLVALALGTRGLGAGLSQAPFGKAATDAVEAAKAQAAAGLYGAIRYSGLALGAALVGILLQSRLVHYKALEGGAAALPAYRELWLVMLAIVLVGGLLTVVLGRARPAAEVTAR